MGRKVIQLGLVAAFVAGVVLFRDRLPDPRALWDAALGADLRWLLVAVVAQGASLATFARLQARLLKSGGVSMPMSRAHAVTYAGNALSSSLPGGAAIGAAYTYRQYRLSGAPPGLAMSTLALSGLASSLTFGLLALLALLGTSARVVAAIVLASVIVVGLVLWATKNPTQALGRLVPARIKEGWRAARPSRSDVLAVGLMATLNWILDVVSLVAAAAAVGISLPAYAVAVGYFAAQLAGAIPLFPGGLGAIEGSLGTALVAFGAAAVPAGAAVVLYRLVSYWIVLAVGWLAWMMLQFGERGTSRISYALSCAGPDHR